jgi:hypothetical protein
MKENAGLGRAPREGERMAMSFLLCFDYSCAKLPEQGFLVLRGH